MVNCGATTCEVVALRISVTYDARHVEYQSEHDDGNESGSGESEGKAKRTASERTES